MSRPMQHWVCFECRKQFRKPLLGTEVAVERGAVTPVPRHPCPECKRLMVDMGKYVRPPRRNNGRAWQQLRLLAQHGIRFTRAGDVAFMRHILNSTTGRLDARPLTAKCLCHVRTEGQRLLKAIVLNQQRRQRRKS